jgi:hypothetical protein
MKSDGHDFALVNGATHLLGIDWVPVALKPDQQSTSKERVPKRTACGNVTRAALFIAPAPTKEFDWTFHIEPTDQSLLDTTILRANSKRVRAFPKGLNLLLETIGKKVPLLDGTAKRYDATKWDAGIIEAEVTPPRSLLEAGVTPFACRDGKCVLGQPNGKVAKRKQFLDAPKQLCAYGPWIQEAVHYFHPEIHPAEALYWREASGAWNILMLQDGSDRFDARRPGRWYTVLGQVGGAANQADAEHWVQEAMIGEFTIPLGPGFAAPIDVTLLGEEHLDDVGKAYGDYPASQAPHSGTSGEQVRVSDPRIHAAIFHKRVGDAGFLVIRARIRGGVQGNVFENQGAYARVRITGTKP